MLTSLIIIFFNIIKGDSFLIDQLISHMIKFVFKNWFLNCAIQNMYCKHMCNGRYVCFSCKAWSADADWSNVTNVKVKIFLSLDNLTITIGIFNVTI